MCIILSRNQDSLGKAFQTKIWTKTNRKKTTCYRVYHEKCRRGWRASSIKTAGRNINNLRYADDTTLMAKSEEELNSLLMKVKEESEKASLKLSIQKTKIKVSSPITSWKIGGKQWRQLQSLFSWAPKSLKMVTAAMKFKDSCFLKEKVWPA